MRLALGLATIGIILGVAAALAYVSASDDAGNAQIVEKSLGGPPIAPSTTPEPSPSPRPTLQPDERWTANELSLLSDIAGMRGPKPVRLRIDKLGIDAAIGEYGLDDEGQMDVPDNVADAGWYKYGPSPGDRGSAVIAAHVDLAGPGRGLFYDLKELEPGDVVLIGFEDGGEKRFHVVARTTYLKDQLPIAAIFSRDGDPTLTLVTCGGGFSQSTRRYDSNVVVYAKPDRTMGESS